ncbi:MAG TPA: Hsp20/alpha crystallin family protein [Polyangiaceae bacterium]|nr:Hsp20/alpha crystallin family protein [Polyangiaceae bacterium]
MLTGWRDFDQTFRAFDLMQHELDRVFGPWALPSLFVERARRSARTSWPSINAFETKEAFVYTAEVPGLGEGDVSVLVEDESLVLRGERKSDAPPGYETHMRERAPYAFSRKLPLPGRVDAEGVTATMKDGILTVTLPKSKETLPRQIAVKAV